MSQHHHFSARLALLDKQLVDLNGSPIGRVDDLELATPAAGAGTPEVTALLTGAEALGGRLDGHVGTLMSASARRLRRGTQGPTRLDPELVAEIEPKIKLRLPLSQLHGIAGLERWLGERIARLPGAGDATE